MNFSPGDVLLVPVVFSDGIGRKNRPVVVIYNSVDADLLVAPVTSHTARSARDIPLANWQRSGLRLPSIVRLEKFATVQKSTVVKKMGRLTPEDWENVKTILKKFFADILAS
jgi:mRNA interferase MazF